VGPGSQLPQGRRQTSDFSITSLILYHSCHSCR